MTMLTVVIPAYNEESGIAAIIERVLSIQGKLADVGVSALELLVVDDGSADRTREIVAELSEQHAPLRLIGHTRNGGYGAALKTGFREAQGELVGFLDADGTYPPEYFPTLCQAALGGWELVIGSRMAGADSQMPFTRRIGNLFFANLLSLMGRQRVTDSASGMRVFQRTTLQRFYPLPDGLNLTPVMSTRAIHEGIRIAEVPIPYSERVGNSKLSVVRDGSVFLGSMVWTVMKYNPVRILGLMGAGGIGAALLVLLWLIFSRLAGVTTLGPIGVAAVFAGAVLGFTGLSLITLGITFNYLVALFHKSPMQQGVFGRARFPRLDHHFGWLGGTAVGLGLLIGIIALVLGLNGWTVGRLWLYMLGSAMSVLIGVQLFINWVLLRVLDELNERDALIEREIQSVRTAVSGVGG